MINNDASQDAVEPVKVHQDMHELRAFQRGTAVLIMPVRDGWKIAYLSGKDFEGRAGTTFWTLEAAMVAVAETLARANTDEEKHIARDMERLMWKELSVALQNE